MHIVVHTVVDIDMASFCAYNVELGMLLMKRHMPFEHITVPLTRKRHNLHVLHVTLEDLDSGRILSETISWSCYREDLTETNPTQSMPLQRDICILPAYILPLRREYEMR